MSVAHICYLCGQMHEVTEDAGQILCPECRAWAEARGIVPASKEEEDEDDRDEA